MNQTSPFPTAIRPPINDAERHRAVQRMMEVFELVQGKSLDGRSLRHCEKLLQQAALALGMSYRKDQGVGIEPPSVARVVMTTSHQPADIPNADRRFLVCNLADREARS